MWKLCQQLMSEDLHEERHMLHMVPNYIYQIYFYIPHHEFKWDIAPPQCKCHTMIWWSRCQSILLLSVTQGALGEAPPLGENWGEVPPLGAHQGRLHHWGSNGSTWERLHHWESTGGGSTIRWATSLIKSGIEALKFFWSWPFLSSSKAYIRLEVKLNSTSY